MSPPQNHDPTTRTCPTCEATHHRFDLVLKADVGALVCPVCGEVLAIQHALKDSCSHVLLPTVNRGNSAGAVHQPSSAEPLKPACAETGDLGANDDEYQPRDPARVPDSHTRCSVCWNTLNHDDTREPAEERTPSLDARLRDAEQRRVA